MTKVLWPFEYNEEIFIGVFKIKRKRKKISRKRRRRRKIKIKKLEKTRLFRYNKKTKAKAFFQMITKIVKYKLFHLNLSKSYHNPSLQLMLLNTCMF